MSEQAKRRRSAAKGRLTRAINAFREDIETGNYEIDIVESLFKDVETAWKIVEEKHDEYIANFEEVTDTEERWITEIQTEFKEVRKCYITAKKSSVDKNTREAAYRCREIEYNSFTGMCEDIKGSIRKNISDDLLVCERDSVILQHGKVKETHNKYCVLLPSNDDKFNLKWISDVSEVLAEMKYMVDKHLKGADTVIHKSKTNFRLQKIPLPKFEGNIRNYPRFKRNFVELVLPTLSVKEAEFGLRQCLSNEVESNLDSCDDDIDSMLKMLDKKLGDPCKLTDAVVSEIKHFKSMNADQKHTIIQFINAIERGYNDLKHIDMEKEISNANVVSIIENKLPHYIAERWFLKIYKEGSKIDRKNKFPSLLSFLKTERDALEYGMSELRITQSKLSSSFNITNSKVTEDNSYIKCLIHNTNDHKTQECRVYNNKSVKENFFILRSNNVCYCCLIPGHLITNCPNKQRCSESCDQLHHISLHNNEINGLTSYIEPHQKHGQSCLLLIQYIQAGLRRDNLVNIFWDSGSSISLITEKKAKELKLSGLPVMLSVTTTRGKWQKVSSHRYNVDLFDRSGRKYQITAFGIDNITNAISHVEVDELVHLFNNINKRDVQRPEGEVDILVGLEYAAWHPVREQSYEHLLIYGNVFGKCLGGHHPSLNEGTRKNAHVKAVVNYISSLIGIKEFFDVESMGTECTPRCGNCRCGKCPIGGKEL